nr:DUF2793 domain-containing protein [Ruegeria sp. HKCCD8929]
MSGAHRTIQAVANDPPPVPIVGTVWVVGDTPTTAWAGHANEIAIWAGASWLFTAPVNGMTVTDAAGADWRWDQTAGQWVTWKAAAAKAGPVLLASEAEALAGTVLDKAVTPATLAKALGKGGDGLPLHLDLSNAGETAQSIPQDVPTRCENMVLTDGNLAAMWDGARFTVDANTLGIYGVFNRLNTFGETGEGAQTWKNGARIQDYQLSPSAGSANVVPFTHFVKMLVPGDYLEFYHKHQSDSAKANNNSSAQIYRLLPYTPVA